MDEKLLISSHKFKYRSYKLFYAYWNGSCNFYISMSRGFDSQGVGMLFHFLKFLNQVPSFEYFV